jgi:hypothetical protein
MNFSQLGKENKLFIGRPKQIFFSSHFLTHKKFFSFSIAQTEKYLWK